jgi:hypothetical protein
MSLRMSTDLKASIVRCHAWAAAGNIDATTKRFSNWVYVVFDHNGGTVLYADAFTVDDPEDKQFCWVLTEHRGYHVFAKDELECCVELQEVGRVQLGEPPP